VRPFQKLLRQFQGIQTNIEVAVGAGAVRIPFAI
jgi:hypothetical protein